MAPVWLDARPLADGEVVGHLPAHDALGHQLQRHRQDHPDGHGEVAGDERDRQPGGGADHEVAELHRQPEEHVEPIRQPVDGVEQACLGRTR